MILPGCEDTDSIVFTEDTRTDFVCPLTQDRQHEFCLVEFLTDLYNSNKSSTKSKKRRLQEETVYENIKGMEPASGICRIDQCKHEFLSVPFLYHVMTTGFRCPICRCGSASEIMLTPTLSDFPLHPELWTILANIAQDSRERHRVEETAEELSLLAQMQNAEITAINNMSVEELIEQIQITILFNIYREPPTAISFLMPSARVEVQLRPNILRSLTNIFHQADQDIPLIYESGQAQRSLSVLMRNASQFSFTLFAQANEGEFAFFQSPVIATSDVMQDSTPFVVSCAPVLNGSVRMYWEGNCGDENKILRKIDYVSTCTGIRTLSLRALNGITA